MSKTFATFHAATYFREGLTSRESDPEVGNAYSSD